MRKIFASQEASYQAKHSPNKIVKVYSFFPVDKSNCDCAEIIKQWKKRMGESNAQDQRNELEKTKFIECPRNKKKLIKFQVVCEKCGDLQGQCYASDSSLSDWCDFHYVQWTNGVYWRGCFTPHISPISEQLCLECCCGNDTRDFRANMTLNQKGAEKIESQNNIGRAFNTKNSKFIVRQIS